MNKDNYHEQGNIIIMLLLLPLGHISNNYTHGYPNGYLEKLINKLNPIIPMVIGIASLQTCFFKLVCNED